jgi:BirA family biotin operon repressor/biotin-[acetyl-CoA-carboxylase] ligase
MSSPIDVLPHLDLKSIDNLLQTKRIGKVSGCPNEVWDIIGSTNDRANELAAQGAPEGVIVLARQQTAGRGRHGRTWSSPADAGVHMSCILRPGEPGHKLPVYTLAIGVACARAILACTGIRVGLKWVNDLVYDGKKLGGILCEMSPKGKFTAEGKQLESALIVGIGINVHSIDAAIPEEIKDKVEWLERATGQSVNLNAVVASVAGEIEHVVDALAAGKIDDILHEWRTYSATLHKNVVAISGDQTIRGLAQDIDSDGALLIKTPEGEIVRLQAGEISIRTESGNYV